MALPEGPVVRIVLHGKQAGNEDVRDAITAWRKRGHRIEVRVTWEPGDAQRLAREAVTEGVDTVVAGGGDGTLNEVVAGLMASNTRDLPSLGVLPLGTGNDFAECCGIPLDPWLALRLLWDCPARMIDVGLVGNRTFINLATGGCGSRITVATSEELKRVLGRAAYFMTGLTHFSDLQPVNGRIRGPDYCWEGDFVALGIGNGRQAGGGHILCPRAVLNDGLLDLTILPQGQDGEWGALLKALLSGGVDTIEHYVVMSQLSWIEVETDELLQVNLDGEPVSDTHFHFETLPGRIRAHLPQSAPLASEQS